MKTITITRLREMSGVELVVLDEPVEITSNKTGIGYFVPTAIWAETSAFADQWLDGFDDASLPPAQDIPDA